MDARYAGLRILTLGEFLAEYATRLPVCLEIKAPSVERAVLDAVAATPGVLDVIYTSFSIDSVARVRELSPTARTGYLARDFGAASVELALRAGANQICPPARDLSPEAIDSARRLGLEVRAWGVSDDALLARAIALGVDGLTTNWPDRGLELARG
jgi:glycerophosphoryl diester phosphodiesterase